MYKYRLFRTYLVSYYNPPTGGDTSLMNHKLSSLIIFEESTSSIRYVVLSG